MKNLTPNQIAIASAATLSILVMFSLMVIGNYYVEDISWIVIITPTLVSLVLGYIIIYYALEKFIYRKVKLIYKNIHSLKAPKGSISDKVKLNEDIFHEVEQEVIEWTKDKSLEIEQLKNLESYRKEFLANVSHELKTPVFNIQGYIETLIDGGLLDKEINLNYLNKASKNVDRLNAIINDLEMITLIEDGKLNLEKTKFDIHELTKDVFDITEMRADLKGINLTFKEDCDKPFFVVGDRGRIRQVLINLVNNSIKYGKEEGKTQVGFYDMSENILTDVSDDGIGIAESHLPRLYERFYRVDKSRSREQGGTGLGLSIVKHIIEAHNQTINVRSTEGVGSTFGFTLQKG